MTPRRMNSSTPIGGPVGRCLIRREEFVVDEITARERVPLERLVDGLLWSLNVEELAEELDVTVETALCRLRTLSDEETADLSRRFGYG